MVESVSSQNQVTPNSGCEDVKSAIAVKMMQEVQKSQQIAGDIIQDTVNISQEAIDACIKERS